MMREKIVLVWEKLMYVRLAENEMESRAATFFACYLERMLVAPWCRCCCCCCLLLLRYARTLQLAVFTASAALALKLSCLCETLSKFMK
jgi:hypothetical protein